MASDLAPELLAERLTERLSDPACPCRGLATPEQIDLRIREADRHFWSPQLVIIVEPRDTGGSRLHGVFGPNSSCWTMFLACYAFVVLSAIFAAFYGFSQMIADESAWALWTLPVPLVLVVLIYVAAGIGQRLGRDQTNVLLAEVERATGVHPEVDTVPALPHRSHNAPTTATAESPELASEPVAPDPDADRDLRPTT